MIFVCVQIVVKSVDSGVRGGLADGSGGCLRDGKIEMIIAMTKNKSIDGSALVIDCVIFTQSPSPQKPSGTETPKTPL